MLHDRHSDTLALETYGSTSKGPFGHRVLKSSLILPLATRFASLTDIRGLGFLSKSKVDMYEVDKVLQDIKEFKQKVEKDEETHSKEHNLALYNTSTHHDSSLPYSLGNYSLTAHYDISTPSFDKYTDLGSHFDTHTYGLKDYVPLSSGYGLYSEGDAHKTSWTSPTYKSEQTGTHPIALNSTPYNGNAYISSTLDKHDSHVGHTALTQYGVSGKEYKGSEHAGYIVGDIWTTEYVLKPATASLKKSILGTATVRPQIYMVDGDYAYEQRNVLLQRKKEEKSVKAIQEIHIEEKPVFLDYSSKIIAEAPKIEETHKEIEVTKKEEVPKEAPVSTYTFMDYSSFKSKEDSAKIEDHYSSYNYNAGSVESPSLPTYNFEPSNSYNLYTSHENEPKETPSDKKELFFQPNVTISYEIIKTEKKGEDVHKYLAAAKEVEIDFRKSFVPEDEFLLISTEKKSKTEEERSLSKTLTFEYTSDNKSYANWAQQSGLEQKNYNTNSIGTYGIESAPNFSGTGDLYTNYASYGAQSEVPKESSPFMQQYSNYNFTSDDKKDEHFDLDSLIKNYANKEKSPDHDQGAFNINDYLLKYGEASHSANVPEAKNGDNLMVSATSYSITQTGEPREKIEFKDNQGFYEV